MPKFHYLNTSELCYITLRAAEFVNSLCGLTVDTGARPRPSLPPGPRAGYGPRMLVQLPTILSWDHHPMAAPVPPWSSRGLVMVPECLAQGGRGWQWQSGRWPGACTVGMPSQSSSPAAAPEWPEHCLACFLSIGGSLLTCTLPRLGLGILAGRHRAGLLTFLTSPLSSTNVTREALTAVGVDTVCEARHPCLLHPFRPPRS